MAKLEVSVLGRFTVASEAGPFELSDSPARLLAYLALFPGRLTARTRIAGALWPDLTEARARANLSTTTWRLRQKLTTRNVPSEVVHSTNAGICIDADLSKVDVEHFRRETVSLGTHADSLDALARAARALDLYRGDLLEDWDVEWATLERENLKHSYLITLCTVAIGFERRSRLDLGLQYAKRAVAIEPLDETAQRLLIRLLVLNGDTAAAMDQFQRFTRLLRSELGVEPEKETEDLVSGIRRLGAVRDLQGRPRFGAPLTIRPERVPLVGRTQERGALLSLLENAVLGKGGGLLFLGEPGVGKSRLAEWAAEEWSARGGATGRGRCIEFNEPVPYQPVLDSLEPYLDGRDLAGIAGEGNGSATPLVNGSLRDHSRGGMTSHQWPPGKLLFFSRLRERLAAASQRRPLLLVIEDLQWADASTLDFIAYLLERARGMRLAMLLTSRQTGSRRKRSSILDRISRYCVAILKLGPLTEIETSELVRSLLDGGRVSPEMSSWVFAETEGNPLFVVETLRLLQQMGDMPNTKPGSTSGASHEESFGLSQVIPDGVRSAVYQRLALIEPSYVRVAEVAAVLGRGFDEELLGMVTGLRENRLSRAIEELLNAGVFERERAGYRFSHDKIRAVCYESLPARARRTHHARAASALANMPETPRHRVAWHQSCAGQWYLACASWENAGDGARDIYAYEEALRAYRHAISCIRKDRTRDTLQRYFGEFAFLVKCDEVLVILGKLVDRRLLLDRMGAIARQTKGAMHEATWLMRRSLLEDHVGNFASSVDLARRAWRIARDRCDRSVECEALQILAWAYYRTGRHRRSQAVSRLALMLFGDTMSALKAVVLVDAANTCNMLGDYASAISFARQARVVRQLMGCINDDPLVLSVEAITHRQSGNPGLSRACLAKALDIARDMCDPIMTVRIGIHIATADAVEGKLGESLRKLRAVSLEARSKGYLRVYLSYLNEVANGVGRLVANYRWATHAIERALGLIGPAQALGVFAMLKGTHAQLLIDEGRFEKAVAAANTVLGSTEFRRECGGMYLESLMWRGIAFLHMNRLGDCIADLESAWKSEVEVSLRILLPDTLSHLALAYAKFGDADRAIVTSTEALARLAEINYANHQPQRILWHHYLILEMLGREPRLLYLERAVSFIEAQASTLSRAQGRRLRERVRLNREILDAWERHRLPEHRQPAEALSS